MKRPPDKIKHDHSENKLHETGLYHVKFDGRPFPVSVKQLLLQNADVIGYWALIYHLFEGLNKFKSFRFLLVFESRMLSIPGMSFLKPKLIYFFLSIIRFIIKLNYVYSYTLMLITIVPNVATGTGRKLTG